MIDVAGIVAPVRRNVGRLAVELDRDEDWIFVLVYV